MFLGKNCATPAVVLLLTCALLFVEQSQTKSMFSVGTRILDDQLLVKDILEAKVLGALESPEVAFQYSVPQPITYIEILSNADVYAEINFSYQNDIVSGRVKGPMDTLATMSLESHQNNNKRKPMRTFDVHIFIYGFNDTVLNVSPAYLINRNTEYKGLLEPNLDAIEDEDNYINGDEQYETIKKFDDIYVNNNNSQANHEYLDENDQDSAANNRNENEDEDEDEDDEQIEFNSINDQEDKVIEVGHRQTADQLLYETFQTSSRASTQPADHTVVFYYIDSNFITNIQFVIYGHYSGKSAMSDEYKPPVAEYSHFSPTSLKATITDFNTTSLFVHMFVFGYRPADVNAISYVPYLRAIAQEQQVTTTSGHRAQSEMSPLERLKLFMKNEQNDKSDRRDHVDQRPDNVDENEVKSSANNMISISGNTNTACASGATPSILIHLQSNAVVIHLLLSLLFVWFNSP